MTTIPVSKLEELAEKWEARALEMEQYHGDAERWLDVAAELRAIIESATEPVKEQPCKPAT